MAGSGGPAAKSSAPAAGLPSPFGLAAAGQAPAMAESGAAMARSSAPAAAATESGGPTAIFGAPAARLPSPFGLAAGPFMAAPAGSSSLPAPPSLAAAAGHPSLAVGPFMAAPTGPSLAAATSLDAAAAARPSLTTAAGSPSLATDFPAYIFGIAEAGSALGSVDAGVLALGTAAGLPATSYMRPRQFTNGAPWSSPAPVTMLTGPAQHLLSLPLAPPVLHPPPSVWAPWSSGWD
ncbi:hypothetical protein GUJ93_ZPchr0002g24269 [Zizania palustris]|uniref:Uncharacterized protein n=1 Tax=Zizania palustris TaxID=103762 RepID=A0A8J5SRK8_ZIZPA|nr:hypothetical protein GUJ93_ZPchr0002g24269 [Zizania palustris]